MTAELFNTILAVYFCLLVLFILILLYVIVSKT